MIYFRLTMIYLSLTMIYFSFTMIYLSLTMIYLSFAMVSLRLCSWCAEVSASSLVSVRRFSFCLSWCLSSSTLPSPSSSLNTVQYSRQGGVSNLIRTGSVEPDPVKMWPDPQHCLVLNIYIDPGFPTGFPLCVTSADGKSITRGGASLISLVPIYRFTELGMSSFYVKLPFSSFHLTYPAKPDQKTTSKPSWAPPLPLIGRIKYKKKRLHRSRFWAMMSPR